MTHSALVLKTLDSPPIAAGDQSIVLQSHVMQLRLPFVRFTWNRPTAVRVRRPDRPERILRVNDVTRLTQVLIAAAGIAGAILIGLALRQARRQVEVTNDQPTIGQ